MSGHLPSNNNDNNHSPSLLGTIQHNSPSSVYNANGKLYTVSDDNCNILIKLGHNYFSLKPTV